MNRFFTVLCLCLSQFIYAQSDSLTMGAGATNMVFYSLATGAKTTASNDDWHIAFSARFAAFPNNTNQSAAIRINESNGLKLYHSTQKLSQFASFDTTGWESWQRMHNPDTTWAIGAFNINKDFQNYFNYGWGSYTGPPLHNVGTDSTIYLIQMPNGDFKKFAILNLSYDTAFNVMYSNLDNSSPVTMEIRKRPYKTKMFVYLDMNTQTLIDKEPAITDWDMVYQRYNNTTFNQQDLTQDMGILTNDACAVYKASGASAQQNCSSGPYSNYINQIGKLSAVQLNSNEAYFVKRGTSQYRIQFTRFDGSYTGVVAFDKTQCTAAGIEEAIDPEVSTQMYPVPATEKLNVSFVSERANTSTITLMDISGRVIKTDMVSSTVGENTHTLDLSGIETGNYIVSLSSESIRTSRLISVVK